jgi:tellurite resistance protein
MEIIVGIFIIYFVFRAVKGTSNTAPEKPSIKVRFEASGSSRQVSESDRYRLLDSSPAKWYSAGQAVNVQGYNIPGGMVYVGDTLLDNSGYQNDASLINPRLNVSPAEPWDGGDEMSYWPQYANLSPRCRGAYLKWLASGRSESQANIGYVFLFFYGLERRLFVDGQEGIVSTEERAAIVNEVIRLLKIYGKNRSFRGYASNLLAMEWVLYQNDKPSPAYLDFNDRYCSEPFQVVLARYVVSGQPIPADVALRWTLLNPEISLRTPARRCAKEFRELFICRYTKKYGAGFIVKPNKTLLKLEYRAASSSLRGGLKLKIQDLPNPFSLAEPLKKLRSLTEECTLELEPYSRFLGRKENSPDSMSAMALLPPELMQQTPTADSARSQLAQACADGACLISVKSLFSYFTEKTPLQIGKKESENLAALVEGLGFGIAPDIRFHNMKPLLEGEVAVFSHGHGTDFQPSREFRSLCTILRLGAIISQIDNDLSTEEEATLQSLVNDNPSLTKTEKCSLLAFLKWSLHTPQGTAGIKQRLAEASSVEKTAISRILISVALADGRIDPKEVKHLEKLYPTLGLNKEQVISDLHNLVAANEPVTVSLRDNEPTFTIPRPATADVNKKGFMLNEELIRIRTEETRQVKGILEGIFADQEEVQSDKDLPPITSPAENPLDALDKAHQDLFHRLLQQEKWERSSLLDLCKELGLMVDGAMEVLNEWSFDNANAPLIDDGDPVFIDVNLAREIINGQ